MFEIVGIIFGGVSRLTQHWMEMKDQQRERDHEARMFEKQINLQAQAIDAERDLRRMDYRAQESQGEMDLLATAIQAQSREAAAAGGWAAALSATVRPVISYWLLVIYSAAKIATLTLTVASGEDLAVAVAAAYTAFDGALLGSIVSFWFADRSLRKIGR